MEAGLLHAKGLTHNSEANFKWTSAALQKCSTPDTAFILAKNGIITGNALN